MTTINRTNVPNRHWHTSMDTINKLWATLHSRRKGTINVKVPAEDLANLLRDHATSADAMEG